MAKTLLPGKSTLIKHALLHLRRNQPDCIIASYFFNARGRDLEKSRRGMLGTFLCQLLSSIPALMDSFLPIFLEKRSFQGLTIDWHDGELRDFILSITSYSNLPPIILLVDALDECSEAEVWSVVSLLEDLGLQAAASRHSIRICLSSRHYPSISMAKNLELVVETQSDHRKDIAIYISDKLKDKEGHNVDKLQAMAEGIFQWTILVIEIINRDFDEGLTTDVASTFSSGLDNVFLTLLEKNNRRRDQTILMLQWVLFSDFPLTPTELYFAVMSGTERNELPKRPLPDSSKYAKFMTTTSRSLIELRRRGRNAKTQFIHESVKDFLMRSDKLQLLDSQMRLYAVPDGHDRLIECCFSYIDMIPLEEICRFRHDSVEIKCPFLRYAFVNLIWHAEKACERHLTLGPRLHCLLDEHTIYTKFERLCRDYYRNEGVSQTKGTNVEAGLPYMLEWWVRIESVRALLQLPKNNIDIDSGSGGLSTAPDVASTAGARSVADLHHIATRLLGVVARR